MLLAQNTRQARRFSKTKNKTLKIITIAPRGTGKTTFVAACCSLHLASPEKGVKFSPCDRATKKQLDSLLGFIATRGKYPPATPITQTLKLALKIGIWKKPRASFQWADLPGELCTHENSEYINEVLQANAFLGLIDAEAAISATWGELERLFEPITELASALSKLVTAKKYAPIAIVFTKTDCVDTAEKIQKLKQVEQELKEALSDYPALVYQVSHSATKMVPTKNGYVLKNDNCLQIIASLLDCPVPQEKLMPKGRRKLLLGFWAIAALLIGGLSIGQIFSSTLTPNFEPTRVEGK